MVKIIFSCSPKTDTVDNTAEQANTRSPTRWRDHWLPSAEHFTLHNTFHILISDRLQYLQNHNQLHKLHNLHCECFRLFIPLPGDDSVNTFNDWIVIFSSIDSAAVWIVQPNCRVIFLHSSHLTLSQGLTGTPHSAAEINSCDMTVNDDAEIRAQKWRAKREKINQ